jgi:ubiquinone/menaquinone biosynthesis C-methylase UbiE
MRINKDFTNVTEQPGQKATKEQFSIMMTRYNLAANHCENNDVLEVACGSGTGLGYISKKAKSVVGGDIDSKLVEIAKSNYEDNPKVKVLQLDALNLPFETNTFDVVLLYEAIYYLPNVEQFLKEVKRVLRQNGQLIISTVNCQWHGFNPSPFSTKYWSVQELNILLQAHNYTPSVLIGFFDPVKGANSLVSLIRKTAVKLRLIPDTMEGKERLKRLFYGSLQPIPAKIYENMAPIEPLKTYDSAIDLALYKQLYIVGNLN